MDLVLSSLSEGLLWSIMAIGIFLTFRILDIADMTAEGAFPLGGCSRCVPNPSRAKPLASDPLLDFSRDASWIGLWSSSYQDEDPSALNRDCDSDGSLFDQY